MKKRILFLVLYSALMIQPAFAQESADSPKTTEPQVHSEMEKQHESEHEGSEMPFWSVIPFALILASIAIFPIASEATAHWWENNNNKLIVSLSLGAISLAVLLLNGWQHRIIHTIVFDYIPFIILLGSLYYISGGILLKGDIEATPLNNTLFLLIGTILASFIGTTGASMLMIRPLLKTNSERKRKVHTVVFFIFLVSNIGGSLTPLGDPPLFLGYLQGVPFTWTFNLFAEMAFSSGILLLLYFIWDMVQYQNEDRESLKRDQTQIQPISLSGQVNFIWLIGVVLCVAFLNKNYIPQIGDHPYFGFIREACMIFLIFLSFKTSNKEHRQTNKFTLHPIIEVAYLFIGIFLCMIPALILLEAHGKELGITEPWQYFWSTGLFSSVLDNAPTYLTFLSLAKGSLGLQTVAQILSNPAAEELLKAISIGAVFMGANTYIGNAPNFMVKSIAEESRIKMPSFLGYVFYSASILIPLFLLLTLVFFD